MIATPPTPSPNACRYCGTVLTGAINVNAKDQRPPDPGDLSICATCGEMSAFDAEMRLQPLTPEQIASFKSSNPSLWKRCQIASLSRRRQYSAQGTST